MSKGYLSAKWIIDKKYAKKVMKKVDGRNKKTQIVSAPDDLSGEIICQVHHYQGMILEMNREFQEMHRQFCALICAAPDFLDTCMEFCWRYQCGYNDDHEMFKKMNGIILSIFPKWTVADYERKY